MARRESCWKRYIPVGPKVESMIDKMCCCCDESDEEEEVIVYMNDPEANAAFRYPDNFIKTSKYTFWSFLPFGLLFQFTKASNLYFLLNMIFSLIPGVAPINPAFAIAPLVVVLAIALIKEGVEDIKRHKADNKANSLPAEVLRGNEMVKIMSRHVQVGDIIKIYNGEEVRADVILFASSVDEGQAFIDTCNLDGETSLKNKKAIEETWNLNCPENCVAAKGVLHTSSPDPGLLSWTGALDLNGNSYSLSLDQFLYRGCVLRNTDWVWGMVAYAGIDTKMFRNLKEKPPKSSNLDKKLNYLIIVVFIIQNIALIIVCSLSVWWNSRHHHYWYLDYFVDEYKGIRLWGYRYLTYFILLSYFIPISLFVTIELCKVIQAQWMRVDNDLMEYMTDRWRHCQPNTSNLNEQLAMVKFIFSDKTGTLTENVMKFKMGNVLGTPLELDDLEATRQLMRKGNSNSEAVKEFFLALSICNTIQPFKDETKDHGIKYEGSSPDEVALVEAAAMVGIRLMERTTRTITIKHTDNETGESFMKVYKILATLEFTPERKMMSIIIQDPDTEKITLYNKGADSFIKPQLSKDTVVQNHLETTEAALTDMSSIGLRTLLICSKSIEKPEFLAWQQKFIEAGKLLTNRSEKVDEVCLQMESAMRLVGATGIEDKLQDQVPETLSFFLGAGVIIWMLTGDKRETAVTIAATSTLLDPRTDFVDHIDIGSLEPKSEAAIEKVGKDLREIEAHVNLKGTDEGRNCSFVVDGPALVIAMEYYFDQFLDLSQRVNSAVCCRLTPIQKANVVHMFQRSTGLTALAIGDGANDVSMIQEGRVGVGIIGLEGAQAALAADYAIPRFKHLRKLCAVHGRYSLYRNASCILVSFYKNIILAVLQIIFAPYTGFSGQTLFDGLLLTCFNIILTSIPPFFMGIFDKDLCEEALLEKPQLYTPLASGLYFNVPVLLLWFAEAVFHAFVIFFSVYPYMQKLDGTSHNISGPLIGTQIFCAMTLVVLTRFGIRIRYWQVLQFVGMGVSFLLFMFVVLVYGIVPPIFNTNFYYQIYNLMMNAKFWFYCMYFICVVLVIDLSAIFVYTQFFPSMTRRALVQYVLRHGEP